MGLVTLTFDICRVTGSLYCLRCVGHYLLMIVIISISLLWWSNWCWTLSAYDCHHQRLNVVMVQLMPYVDCDIKLYWWWWWWWLMVMMMVMVKWLMYCVESWRDWQSVLSAGVASSPRLWLHSTHDRTQYVYYITAHTCHLRLVVSDCFHSIYMIHVVTMIHVFSLSAVTDLLWRSV